MDYKNNFFIFRNIHKSNDEESIIIKNRNTNKIIYKIDNCYKKYFSYLYLELLGIYNLSLLTRLIYRKNNCNKIIKGKKC